MKIPINLASQPFHRDRAMILASLAVTALLLATLGVSTELALQDRRQMADVRQEVSRLRSQLRAITAEQAKMDAVVRQPENDTVLDRSVFLNALLVRKGVSWNRIFSDLEKTIPYNVKLVRVHPTIDADDRVTLDMVVAADGPGPVIEMLKAFKNDPKYGAVDPKSSIPPTQSEPLYRMQLDVTYAQKL